MPKCPDCDGDAVSSLGMFGNGVCSKCHGTGYDIASGSIVYGGESVPCSACDDYSGKCKTCGGTGEV